MAKPRFPHPSMAYAAILVGFARAIYVVLDQGQIVDTIVHGFFTAIAIGLQ